MKKITMWVIFLGLLHFCLWADEKKADPKEKPAPQEKKAEEKPEYPPMDTFIAGLTKMDGFYTLFHKEEKLYALIKKAQLGNFFLMAFSISGGPEFTGWQWGDMLVKWEKVDKNLLLIRPNLKHRTDKATLLSEMVKKTYTDSIVHVVPILSMDAAGNALVDCNHIFKKDIAEIGQLMAWIMGGPSALNSQLSSWSKIKVFPNNAEIEINASFVGGGRGEGIFSEWNVGNEGLVADKRGVRMNIHYSLSHLPKTEYKPRLADNRIGYFLTVHKDYSKPYDSQTQFVRYINRWNLEKADPDLEISPPKKPIVFYIEKNVPVRFRHYIKQGILEWNKAFEKIGIVDAIIVRQQTDKEFANLDPEDVNYNFFRWITSGKAYAMGPSRVNPLSGEILDADIVFDDSFTRFHHYEYHIWGPEALAQMIDKTSHDKLKKFPLWKETVEKKMTSLSKGEPFPWEKLFDHPVWRERWGEKCNHVCHYATGMSHQMAMASLLLSGRNEAEGSTKVPEKYLGEVIKEVVTHEVGHTLGLRHNFKGSSWLKLSEINAKENAPSITSASIMDYNPVNFAPQGTPQGCYQTGGIGPYDYWAIEYGYASPKKGDTEAKMLEAIAKKVAAPGHGYGTDEDTSLIDPDPSSNRWDIGDDLLEFAKNRYALFTELKKNLMTKVVKDGESYSMARRSFDVMLWNYTYASLMAGRYVGGVYCHRDHKGDPNQRPPFVPVSAKKQKEALAFLSEELLSTKNFQFEPQFLSHLAPGRWMHWGSDNYDGMLTYPIHSELVFAQLIPLIFIFSPWNLERIHDMEMQIPKEQDAMTVTEVVRTITESIFSELEGKDLDKKEFTNRSPFIQSLRRNLQQEYLQFLFFMGPSRAARLFYNGDVICVVNLELQALLKKASMLLENGNLKLDAYSHSHLVEMKRLIEKELHGHERK